MTILEARRTTLADYEVLMQAVALRKVDEQQALHEQAMLNLSVQETVGRGKHARPKYRTFKDFYDYEEEVLEAWGDNAPKVLEVREKEEAEEERQSREFMELIKKANS